MSNNKKIAVLSFYSFTNIDNPTVLRYEIVSDAKKKLIYGTVLISPEGINGSLSGKYKDIQYLTEKIKKLTTYLEKKN